MTERGRKKNLYITPGSAREGFQVLSEYSCNATLKDTSGFR